MTKVKAAKPYLEDVHQAATGRRSASAPRPSLRLEMVAMAISNSCTDGKTSRKEVTKALKTINLKTSILGIPVAFNFKGDLYKGPKKGVTYFKIQPNGTYKQVASS